MASPAGGVYIGVGPEQNSATSPRLRPAMAFIIDIRRENLDLHLLYKALFELSADRADFVSRLFSRPRPAGLGSTASVEEIFTRYDGVLRSRELFTGTRRSSASGSSRRTDSRCRRADLAWIDRAFRAFYADGPKIQYWGSRAWTRVRPSYRQLMTTKDFTGRSRSFLASEDGFRFVKGLQSRNLIVPVVGDFGGPSAIRRVGDYRPGACERRPRVLRFERRRLPE